MKTLYITFVLTTTSTLFITAQTPVCINATSIPVNNTQFWNLHTEYASQSGIVYNVGHFVGEVDFDPGPGEFKLTAQGNDATDIYGYEDIFISLQHTSGQFISAYSIGGTDIDEILDIAIDEQRGALYLVGRSSGFADLDPDPIHDASYAQGVFIIKTDLQMHLIWIRPYTHIPSLGSLQINATNGDLVFCGPFATAFDADLGPNVSMMVPRGKTDAVLISLNTDGEFLWAKQIGGTGEDRIYVIALDQINSIVVTGKYEYDADFDPGPAISTLSPISDGLFLAKYSDQGNLLWTKAMKEHATDTIYPTGMAIDVHGGGDIAITGSFLNTVDIDPGIEASDLKSHGYFDIFVSRYTPDGQFIWGQSIGGTNYDYEATIGFEHGPHGALYYAGSAHSIVDFDPGPNEHRVIARGTFCSKLDRHGKFIWAYVPKTTYAFSYQKAMTLIAPDKVLLSGIYFGSQLQFDDFILSTPHSYYNEVGFTFNAILQEEEMVGISNTIATLSPIILYPNPVYDELVISFAGYPNQDVDYVIYNPLMQEIQKGNMTISNGESVLQTYALITGTYFMQLRTQGSQYCTSFIKQNENK